MDSLTRGILEKPRSAPDRDRGVYCARQAPPRVARAKVPGGEAYRRGSDPQPLESRKHRRVSPARCRPAKPVRAGAI